MKLVDVREAAGLVLVHDITEIAKDPDRKHTAFHRGHVVTEDDIPRLLDIGKQNLYVHELSPDAVHENDGALRLAQAIAGSGITLGEPREGKVKLAATDDGAVVVDAEGLAELNGPGDIICVTRRTYSPVRAGDTVAGVRVMPLFTDEPTVATAERIARSRDGLVEVRPLRRFSVGLVVTGSEVLTGRIEDAFGPVMEKKMAELGSDVAARLFSDDKPEDVERAIRSHLADGHDLIIVTGGMSVDPDDRTPGAISAVASRVGFQWAPVLPGCMTMLAAAESPVTGDEVPIIGVPACGIHHDRTLLDILLARLVAGEFPTADEVRGFGHGGLCLECEECTFPNCTFGSV
ncbi:MAG TPA: molybdopterin-binding protein [Armatimonadota bacterium]|nr:molybdopterin-binding protein [Armatimonadota bacterium]